MFEGILGIKKSIFGLDIGLKTMKLVQIRGSGPGAYLVGAIEVTVPEHCITKEGVKNKAELAKVIHEATQKAKPHKITAGLVASALPESLVFTKSLTVPKMTDEELAKNIPFQATEFFPISPDETYMDWQAVDHLPNGSMEILVVAAPKILVNDLIDTTDKAGFELMGLETKPIAITRALVPAKTMAPVLVIDIGAESSAITCFAEGSIKLTSTVTLGGNKIAEDIPEGARIMATEAGHLIKYYQNRLSAVQIFKKIYLGGGGANIKGLAGLIEDATKIQTEVAEPCIKVSHYDPKFAVAIGLALKEIK